MVEVGLSSRLLATDSVCCCSCYGGHAVGSGTGFSPTTIDVETVGALLTVTGRALATTDVITLQAGTTCPTTGGSVVLTSGGTVGGVAGARTLTATTATVSTLVPVG